MAITDIQISEELETNAPSIKYRGNEGPKSPQEMQQMIMASLEEEYLKYVDDMMEQGIEPMTLQQFIDQAMAEGQMSGGQPLPQDPTKPVNPFAPKPTGPVLPDKRQMAAYGGIMGIDGRKQYGIGSYFQKLKDKFVDDIIPNEIKDNPELTAALLLGGDQLLNKGRVTDTVLDSILGKTVTSGTSDGGTMTERQGGLLETIKGLGKGAKDATVEFLGKQTNPNDPKSQTYGGAILSGISKNIVPIVGGLTAGLFTKNTESDTPGLPDDNTALQLADLKKSANLLNQQQGLASGLNFLPTVASRKYTPEEMAITYAQAANGGRIGYNQGNIVNPFSELETFQLKNLGYDVAGRGVEPFGGVEVLKDILRVNQQRPYAMGGRIGFNMGGGADYMPTETMTSALGNRKFINSLIKQMLNQGSSQEEIIQTITEMHQGKPQMAMGGRIRRAEGGLMDLGGMEKDYRAEGGFVPIGREEKADDVPARLSVNEFVFTADAVRNAGGGDIDKGAEVMENMMKNLEAGGQVSEESQGMQGAQQMFETSERLSEVI